ncbi:unnamed protein product [Sphagnum jensenii]|uniref:Uncharacterized protein n=1 Tax=Sphagnum jensenii TaxID=128206 RepID=A0ABP1B052_9BRYO
MPIRRTQERGFSTKEKRFGVREKAVSRFRPQTASLVQGGMKLSATNSASDRRLYAASGDDLRFWWKAVSGVGPGTQFGPQRDYSSGVREARRYAAFGKWKRVGLYTAVVVGGRAVCLRLPRVYHKHTFLLFSCLFACAPSRSAPAAAAAATLPAAHARRAMQIFIPRHR